MIQVDDLLMLGGDEFVGEEQIAVREFKSKEKDFLSNATLSFNGISIQAINNAIHIGQGEKIRKLKSPDTQKSLEIVRAMCKYIDDNSRPAICAPVQLIAPGNEPTSEAEYKVLDKVIDHLKSTEDMGLDYVKLEMSTLRIILFKDY